MRRSTPSLRGWIYASHCLVSFSVLAISALLINLVLPTAHGRRRIAGACSRAFLRAVRIPFSVEGRHRLPSAPCVVVANHASYLDGLVAAAALPPEFAFVIKKEMRGVPLAGTLLRRMGSEFVERFDRRQGATDARRVLKRATGGQSLVFFPEGTFTDTKQIGKFLRGAFATAARAGMPVVAVAIHGTRAALPPGSFLLHRTPIRVEILEIIEGPEARRRSRELIAQAVGEPLA